MKQTNYLNIVHGLIYTADDFIDDVSSMHPH